jgi:hypothetical protein
MIGHDKRDKGSEQCNVEKMEIMELSYEVTFSAD